MTLGGPAAGRERGPAQEPKMRADSEINVLLEQLLALGVSPKYVSRLASELEDHYQDLEAEALRFGVPPEEASTDAKRRLGAFSAIASEFVKRPELGSWLHRSPWLARSLRALVAVYVPAFAAVQAARRNHYAMLRYTAATTGGTGVTLALFLLMTWMFSPDFGWSAASARAEGTPSQPSAVESSPGPRSIPAGEQRDAPAVQPAVQDDEPPLGEVRPRLRPFPSARPSIPEPTYARVARPAVTSSWTDRPRFSAPDARAIVAMIQPSVDLRDFRPVVYRPPSYPLVAARRGIEGYVVVEYTVTPHGEVHAPVIVESSSSLFHEAALDAAINLRYRPPTIRGEPVEIVGVRTVFRFELEV